MLNMGSYAPSLADIAAVTNGNNNNGYGGFGWGWEWILIFALFGGWGGGFGFGGNGGFMQGAYDTQAVVQRAADTGTIISKLDGINNGICSLGYDQLAQMNEIQNTVMQTGFGLQNAITQSEINAMQNQNALSTQLASCCCENRQGQADIKYQMAMDQCATNTNVHQTGDAIIQNQNANFNVLRQDIKDGFCNLEMREQQREIENLRQQLSDCNLANQLRGTAQYVVEEISPKAKPSWNVPNPFTGCCGNNYNSYNNGGCCGNNYSGCCGNAA